MLNTNDIVNKETLSSMLEALYAEIQNSKCLIATAKSFGGIEIILGLGAAIGCFSEEELDVYVERSEGISDLIENGVIEYDPLVFIPEKYSSEVENDDTKS